MSALGFITRMGITRAEHVDEDLKNALIAHVPGMGDVALEVDMKDLLATEHDYSMQVAGLIGEEEADHKAVSELEGKLARAITAAGLKSDAITAAAGNTSQIAMLNSEAASIVSIIEQIGGPEGDGTKSGSLFNAIQKHARSEDRLHKKQALLAGVTAKLLELKSTQQQTKEAMKDAQDELDQAERDRADAQRDAGLLAKVSAGSVAATAMQQRTAELQKRARAATIETASLQQIGGGGAKQADDVIERTLAGAGATGSGETMAEKLARLAKKPVAA